MKPFEKVLMSSYRQ